MGLSREAATTHTQAMHIHTIVGSPRCCWPRPLRIKPSRKRILSSLPRPTLEFCTPSRFGGFRKPADRNRGQGTLS